MPAGSERRPDLTDARPAVGVAISQELREVFFTPRAWDRLVGLAEVTVLDGDPRDPVAYRDLVAGKRAVVTGWGNPPLTAETLAGAPELGLLAHTASSVKPYVTPASWAAGVRVTQAGLPMAEAVAEAALAHTLALLHRLHRFDHAMRAGVAWRAAQLTLPQRELRNAVVGVVGASRCGRAYIQMVRALGSDVLVYDPYLSDADASALGARKVGLLQLMGSSTVVAVHAPVTEETRGMIGRRELEAMPDGSMLVNTARAVLVDNDALLEQVRGGRIDAALDVFDTEPLPVDHPLRGLPNVLLAPHRAGGTVDARHGAGDLIVDEIARFLAGEPLHHEITEDMLARMG